MDSHNLYEAIEKRARICMRYRGGPRIVEPYACEVDSYGRPVLLCFQVVGFSPSAGSGWKRFLVEEIEQVRLLEGTFEDRSDDDHDDEQLEEFTPRIFPAGHAAAATLERAKGIEPSS